MKPFSHPLWQIGGRVEKARREGEEPPDAQRNREGGPERIKLRGVDEGFAPLGGLEPQAHAAVSHEGVEVAANRGGVEEQGQGAVTAKRLWLGGKEQGAPVGMLGFGLDRADLQTLILVNIHPALDGREVTFAVLQPALIVPIYGRASSGGGGIGSGPWGEVVP